MYCITDTQVEYILNDIRRNGVEMEDLQLNLLDHICCILEQQLEDGDDFERHYQATIRQFYKTNLREIEEETIQLLTFKNFYVMRKTLMVSGAISVATFIMGSLFKIMHWPGASVLLFLGITTLSFVFLPLLFLLKGRELKAGADKATLALALLSGFGFALAVLFTVMHWPGGRVLWFISFAVAAFGLIPMYFFSNINKPERKVNTMITTIVLIGGVGLLFTMMSLRPNSNVNASRMYTYMQAEELLHRMQHNNKVQNDIANNINDISNRIKSRILMTELGVDAIPADFEAKGLFMNETNVNKDFAEGEGRRLVAQLKDAVDKYNAATPDADAKITTANTILDGDKIAKYTNFYVLNNITQLQMSLATSGNALATK